METLCVSILRILNPCKEVILAETIINLTREVGNKKLVTDTTQSLKLSVARSINKGLNGSPKQIEAFRFKVLTS